MTNRHPNALHPAKRRTIVARIAASKPLGIDCSYLERLLELDTPARK